MAEVSTLTQFTALYAAVVSTGTAVWNIYKDRNDTGKLKVTVGFRSLVGDGAIEENLLVWNITNIGRRSVFLTHAAGYLAPDDPKDEFKSFLVNDPQLPRRLEPGDYHMAICREYDFSGTPTKLIAIDSLGREFKARKTDVAEVIKTLAELKAKGITKSRVRPAKS